MGAWACDGVGLGGRAGACCAPRFLECHSKQPAKAKPVPCVAPAACCLTLLHPCWSSRACVPQDLKMIFGTREGTTIIFPGTGTGGWESALTNTLSPGDKVRALG